MNEKINKQKTINIVILLLIFIAGGLIHYFYGYFSKSIDVLPDELRYYSIAKSIFNGDGMSIRSFATDYQKMGYTLFLVPFFFIKNGLLRVKAITLANSFLMMSSIFPMYGIMSRIRISNKVKMIFLALFIVFPDVMYTATFMAEIMYWPILLLFIYLWMVNREKKSYILSIILGIICYIGYSTKEVFLAVLLGVVVFELLFPISEHLFNKKEGRKLRDNYKAKKLVQMAIVVVSFVAVYFIIKLVFFWGLGNSYDQMGIDAIDSPEEFGYMIYGFFYYIAAIIITCFVLPFLLPAMMYKNTDKNLRELYVFNILSLLSIVATVAYTITVREDYGDIIPRLHFRYLGPLLIIAIIVFIRCLENKKLDFKLKKGNVVAIVITLFLSFGLFRGVTVKTGVDQFVLDWVYLITESAGDVLGIFIVDAIIVVAVVVILALIVKKKRGAAIVCVFLAMGILGIIGSVTARNRLEDYMYRDPEMVQEAINLNEVFLNTDDNILYVGQQKEYGDENKCMDTYMDRSSKIYYVSREGLSVAYLGNGYVREMEIPVHLNLWKNTYKNVDSIDYVIENVSNNEDYNVRIDNLTPVEELSGNYYKVYKNNNSKTLEIKKGE